MIGILANFECKQCGMIITKTDVLIEKGTTISFKQCNSCGCGAKSGFTLLDFKPMEVGLADRKKEELIVIPNELQKDMKEFMLNIIKEKREKFNNQEKDNLEEERENEN